MKTIVLTLVLLAAGWSSALAAETPPGKTEIVVDDAAGIVKILVKGEEVVRIDQDGVHVAADAGYFHDAAPADPKGDARARPQAPADSTRGP